MASRSPAALPGRGPAIVVEGLTKRFGSVVALAGIDLEVQAGTVFGLLGPNGAGKTTCVRILTTILPPDDGRATVLGYDVATHPAAVRSSIGLAGQYAAVDENLTGRENLRLVGRLTHLPRSVAGQRADELLERFGLADAADRTAKTYSGGMRRRLDLAAALVHRPPVLFLDEPTTGLDPRSRSDLWAVIEELVAEGTTLLLTTQYLEEADRLADRLAVVDLGKVIAEGTVAELKAQMGTTIIEVVLPDSSAAMASRDVLARIGATEVGEDGRTVALKVNDSSQAVFEVVRALDAARLAPETLSVREPTLDDVFLTLTGHHAEEAAAPAAKPAGGRGRRRQRRDEEGAA
jgi:ABC-2 type transport system ATP-binding protein